MGVKTLMLVTVTLLGTAGGTLAAEAAPMGADTTRTTERGPVRPFSDHAATFRPAALTEPERDPDWRLMPTRAAYIGNRQGDLGGFGVKWQMGMTEMALTHEGMGWRWRF